MNLLTLIGLPRLKFWFEFSVHRIVFVSFLVLFHQVPAAAKKYESYLSYKILNNNFIMKGAKENDRLIHTTINYANRLRQVLKNKGRKFYKKKKVCDPRSAGGVFPEAKNSKRPADCEGHIYPAPTNKQFGTRWNPVSHQFDSGYLTGDASRRRNVKLNLKIKGALSFLRKKGYLCNWEIDNDGKKASFKRQDCKDFRTNLEVGKEYLITVDVFLRGKFVHSAKQLPLMFKDYLIVSLGDSFGSGEGNPHTYFPHKGLTGKNGSDRPPMWHDPRCHRSLFASSAQATMLLASSYPNASFSIANFACSGAESGPGLTEPYTGRSSASQVAGLWSQKGAKTNAPATDSIGFFGYKYLRAPGIAALWRSNSESKPAPYDIASQLEQLSVALGCRQGVCDRQPDAVLIYIGVNDVGFGKRVLEIVRGCAKKSTCDEEAITNGIAETKVNLGIFKTRLAAIGIRPKGGSQSIFLVTYPNPLTKKAGKNKRRGKKKGSRRKGFLYCGTKEKGVRNFVDNNSFLGFGGKMLGYTIGEHGAEFAETSIIEPLNGMLREVANNHSWGVMANDQTMLGHGFCADNRYFNDYFEAKNKQGEVLRNFFWLDDKCTDPGNNACIAQRSDPVASGAMHPNFRGHRDVASRIYPKLEDLFKLEKAK